MKIAFIDIDGPMIPSKATFLPNQTRLMSVYDPIAVGMVNRLIADCNMRLVVSSSRRIHGRARMEEEFRTNGIRVEELHDDWATPRLLYGSRSDEIRQWLANHPEVETYVAIEDERLDSDIVAVQCDTYDGFSWRNYIECRYFLGLDNPVEALMRADDKDKHRSTINYFKGSEIRRTVRKGDPQYELVREFANKAFPLGGYRENEDEGI